jgi:hypothetical protein
MDAPKGKPAFAILKDRARDAPGIRHRCRQSKEKKPGKARPFFPFGSPPFRGAPRGLRLAEVRH